MSIQYDGIIERFLTGKTENPTNQVDLGYQIIGTTFDIPIAEHVRPKAFRCFVLKLGVGQMIIRLPIDAGRIRGSQTSNGRH